MKRYDKKGDVETISAKMVYELIESIGESTHKGISVYVTKRDETGASRHESFNPPLMFN
jgi:hypothetical protein